MAFNYSPKVITDGLVLYLDAANRYSYVSGSTSWNDISRTGANGTLTNGPTYNSVNGGSIVFDGVNDYVGLGTPPVLNITGSFTINSWVNLTSLPINENATIYEKGYDNTNEQIYLRINNASGVNALDCGTFGGSNYFTRLFLTGSNATLITTGSWNNIVGQYDGSTWILYVNGSLLSQTTTNQGPKPSTSPSSIGAAYISAGYARFFTGRIATTQIYNRALNATEVLQNYNATKTRFGL